MASHPRPFGFVNALKPPGPTSASFGRWVRRCFGTTTLGHWGTLDPAACGVLVLAVGRATRLLPYIGNDDKTYVFELRLGAATDTADATGHVVRTAPVPSRWRDELDAVVKALIGPIDQVPPMYSAIKVDGRPLYKSARAGQDVVRSARRVEIRALRIIGEAETSARLEVECSAGTYVRTLCEQIGERLGAPAHLGMLLRTSAGPFALADARMPAEIARDPSACLIDPLSVLALERVEVDDGGALRFLHGNDVDAAHYRLADGRDAPAQKHGGVLVLYRGELIGLGVLDEALKPVRVLAGIEENH